MHAARRIASWTVVAASFLTLLSCSTPSEPEPRPPYDYYPANSTPEGAIQRFLATFESHDLVELPKIFTADFRYEFSENADADLIAHYGAAWPLEDEMISAKNIFEGGVTETGVAREPVEDLALKMTPTKPDGDASDGKDPEAYQVLVTVVELHSDLFEVRGCGIQGETIKPQLHRFYLVRGDHAAELGPDQIADAKHWYIYRWRDQTIGTPEGSDGPLIVSWGRIKALYR